MIERKKERNASDEQVHFKELLCDKIAVKWMLTFELLAWFTIKSCKIL